METQVQPLKNVYPVSQASKFPRSALVSRRLEVTRVVEQKNGQALSITISRMKSSTIKMESKRRTGYRLTSLEQAT